MEAESLLRTLLEELPSLRMIAVTPFSFAARGLPGQLRRAVESLAPLIQEMELWNRGGICPDVEQEERTLARVLSHEAEHILKSHKGTVEIASYQNRQLSLRLGGGCAGCASAQITTQRELAAALYREVPLLDSITSTE